jgi:F-type H+-transporting ATPase subunit gamma
VIVVSADRGLAGSYNANLIRSAELQLRTLPGDGVRLVLVGKKSVDYFRRRRYPIAERFAGVMGALSLEAAEAVARAATGLFLAGEVQEVDVLYTAFVSMMSYKVTWERLLPLARPALETAERSTRLDYIFEPDPATILAELLPRYLTTRLLIAMAEAQTAEQGSRMVSMGSATKNASELIDQLVLRRNRARQAAITKELAEIVGGAEALR